MPSDGAEGASSRPGVGGLVQARFGANGQPPSAVCRCHDVVDVGWWVLSFIGSERFDVDSLVRWFAGSLVRWFVDSRARARDPGLRPGLGVRVRHSATRAGGRIERAGALPRGSGLPTCGDA